MSSKIQIENLIGKNIQLVISADDLAELFEQHEARISNLISEKVAAPPKADEKLLTSDQAAEFFGKSRQTIHAWKKAGLLPYIRVSNKIFFKQSDLLKFDVINLKRTN